MQASLNVIVHWNLTVCKNSKENRIALIEQIIFANIKLSQTYQKLFEILEYCRLCTEFKCIFAAILQQGVFKWSKPRYKFF